MPVRGGGEEQQAKIPRLIAELNPEMPDALVGCVEAERAAKTASTGLLAVAAVLIMYQQMRDGQLELTRYDDMPALANLNQRLVPKVRASEFIFKLLARHGWRRTLVGP